MPDESYKVEPLRKVIASGSLRPQFGETRVFVFTDFGSMSEICQNALLKFVEEPQEYNRFVMTADSTAKILETILSRVVVINNGDENAGAKQQDSQSAETARAVIDALKAKSEYNAAAELSKIKDRQLLHDVLQSLLQELSAIMTTAKNPEKVIRAADVVSKYIKRMEVNPNISMTVSACTAELYTVLHN